MSSKSIALFQTHTQRTAPTQQPPADLSTDLLARAKRLRSVGARLLAEANELETIALALKGKHQ